MDWDGVGTFAMFIASGAIGVGVVLLKAYKAKLSSKLEFARLRQAESHDAEDALEQIRYLERKVEELTERVDFTEKLLGSGERTPSSAAEADTE